VFRRVALREAASHVRGRCGLQWHSGTSSMVVFGAAEMGRSGARFQFEICSTFAQYQCGMTGVCCRVLPRMAPQMPSLALPITPNFSHGGDIAIVRRRATDGNLASGSYATISNAVNSVTFATQWPRRLGSEPLNSASAPRIPGRLDRYRGSGCADRNETGRGIRLFGRRGARAIVFSTGGLRGGRLVQS